MELKEKTPHTILNEIIEAAKECGQVYKVSAGYSFSGSSFGGRTSEIVGRTWIL